MVDATTPNVGLILPARNSYINTWDQPVNANFSAIDAILGGTLSLALSNASVALTLAQAQAASMVFSGAITANITVSLPAGYSGMFSVLNGTTGAGLQVVLATTNGGAALVLPQGLRVLVISDGTNVYQADQGLPPGTPIPWLSNTVPGSFLLAYGQVLAASQYPGIYAAYGATFDTGGEGSGNFRMPDLRGVTFAGLDNMGGTARGLLTNIGSSGQTLGAVGGEAAHVLLVAELAAHTHTVTDPGHDHTVTDPGHIHSVVQSNNDSSGAQGGGSLVNSGVFSTSTGSATTGITLANAVTNISVANAGTSTAHNNVQPTMLCNWIVKT